MFLRLWLGDDNRNQEDCLQRICPFSEYMLTYCRKHLIIGHLYENDRRDHQMWRMEHVLPVLECLKALSPDTKVTVPDWGETVLF
jgi:hypothetical protein